MYELNFSGEYAAIPEHMRESIARYVIQGIEPGSFLTAVITNNFRGAVLNADEENSKLLRVYAQWFYWEAPGNCWGSREAMQEWIRKRPLEVAAAEQSFLEAKESA